MGEAAARLTSLRRALAETDDRTLACVQLMGDVAWPHIPPSDISWLVDASLARGRTLVRSLLQTSGGAGVRFDVEHEISSRGFSLTRRYGHSPASRAGYHLCALTTYDGQTGCVELFVDEIAQKSRLLGACGESARVDGLVRMHLLHELFHAVEFSTDSSVVHDIGELRMKGLFGGRLPRRHRRILMVAEMAAHAFACEAMHPEITPWAVDALCLAAEGSLDVTWYMDALDEARVLLNER